MLEEMKLTNQELLSQAASARHRVSQRNMNRLARVPRSWTCPSWPTVLAASRESRQVHADNLDEAQERGAPGPLAREARNELKHAALGAFEVAVASSSSESSASESSDVEARGRAQGPVRHAVATRRLNM